MTTADSTQLSYSVTTRLDPGLMRRAIRRFFWLRTRPFILTTVGLAALTAALAFAIDAEHLLKLLSVFLAIAFPLVWSFKYLRYRRMAERSFANFFGASVTWRFDDESMSWEGAKARSSLHWSLLRRLYLCPDFWVMHFRNNSFNVVPARDVPDEVRRFVRTAAARHGATIIE